MKTKKGISLIMLVITIIVIIILAGAVIISIANNNPIAQANQAVYESNDAAIREEINMASMSYKLGETSTLKASLEKIDGAVIEDSINPDKYFYLTKNNMSYTIYSDGRVKKDKYEIWSGGVATSYSSGDGTEASPYIIKTPEELAYLSQQVNAGVLYEGVYFKLENNLDLAAEANQDGTWSGTEWDPIGYVTSTDSTTYVFGGNFDGNNKVVSGTYVMAQSDKTNGIQGQGLFGANKGTIKNLGIENSYISGYKCIGGIVGYNASTGIVEKCYNTGEIRSDYYLGSPNLGGVVGENDGTVRSCYNTGKVVSTKNTNNGGTGGVIGANIGLAENCYNTGLITGLSATGGVIGYSMSYNGSSPRIANCYNTGAVKSTYSAVGGIAGNISTTVMENCYNSGNIESTSSVVGGIVGAIASNSTVKNSYNTANVISYYQRVGGIAGYCTLGTIQNCYNTGNVSAKKTEGLASSGIIVGGIVARTISTNTISNCYNTGTIYADVQESGGIVGRNEGSISTCYNTGNIKTLNTAGGIVAYNYLVTTNVEYSYNKGNIQADAGAGGVIGRNISTDTPITKCYYLNGVVARGIGLAKNTDGTYSDGVDQINKVESITENIENYGNFLTWIATKK